MDSRCHGESAALALPPPHTVDAMAEDALRTYVAGFEEGRCAGQLRRSEWWVGVQNFRAGGGAPEGSAGGASRMALRCCPHCASRGPSTTPEGRWGPPEVIVGHSIGGLQALEVAQRLGAAAKSGAPRELAALGVPRQVRQLGRHSGRGRASFCQLGLLSMRACEAQPAPPC